MCVQAWIVYLNNIKSAVDNCVHIKHWSNLLYLLQIPDKSMNGNGRRESNALQVDVDDDYVSNYSNIQVVSTFSFCINNHRWEIQRFCTY